MAEFKDPKEMRMAMNGKMGLMTGGILLIFTAVTSTLMYGMNLLSLVSDVLGGNEESVKLLADANMNVSTVRVAAILFLVLAAVEVFAGVLSARFNNRLDKAEFTKKAVLSLLALEILMQVFLGATRLLSLGQLVTSLVIPGYLLWSANKLCKIAKLYPDRINALDTQKGKAQKKAAPSKPAPKKSLHERAMMNAALLDEEDTEDSQVEDTSVEVSTEPVSTAAASDVPDGESTEENSDLKDSVSEAENLASDSSASVE